MEKYVNKKLGDLQFHRLLRRILSVDFLLDFDATRFFPSALWVEKSIYLRIETGDAYTKDMNNEFVQKLNSCDFIQGSASLR